MPSASNPGNIYNDLAALLQDPLEEDTGFIVQDMHSGSSVLGQTIVSDGAGAWVLRPGIQRFTVSRSFTGLTGASQSVAIANFPLNSAIVGVALEIDTTWTGEADAAVALGRTTDSDGYVVAFNLNNVATGFAGIVTGALRGWDWVSNASGAGLAMLFTATALSDLTAGALTWHIFYVQPQLVTP